MKPKYVMAALLVFVLAVVGAATWHNMRQGAGVKRLLQGEDAMARGDYDLAISCFTDYIKARPDDARGYAKRAKAHRNKGLLDDSIADFTEAIKLEPDSAAAYYGRGMAHERAGREQQAKQDFLKAGMLEKLSQK